MHLQLDLVHATSLTTPPPGLCQLTKCQASKQQQHFTALHISFLHHKVGRFRHIDQHTQPCLVVDAALSSCWCIAKRGNNCLAAVTHIYSAVQKQVLMPALQKEWPGLPGRLEAWGTGGGWWDDVIQESSTHTIIVNHKQRCAHLMTASQKDILTTPTLACTCTMAS